MGMVAKVDTALQGLFGDLAETTARECHLIKRNRKFSAVSLTKTFILGFLQCPKSSDEKLAQFALECGVDVTPQAIEQRYTPALADYLQKLFQKATQLIVGSSKALAAVLERFPSVTLLDSSTIALPDEAQDRYRGCGAKNGGGQAALKLQTEWDLRHGALTQMEIEQGRSCDQSSSRQKARRGPNSLRIADLGYFDLAVFAAMQVAAEYFLSRLQFGTHVFLHGKTAAVDLLQWLVQQSRSDGFVDQEIVLGQGQRLGCRLIAWRLPQEQADRRRAKLRQEMRSRKGREPSAARLAWCDWSILVTNLPQDKLTAKEAVVLYRARWQIELLFKRWKSQGLIADLNGSTALRQMIRVWARLLAALVQHWLVVSSVWGNLGASLSKATEATRAFAGRLAAALGWENALEPILALMRIVLTKTCRRNKRSRPGTIELLNNPDLLDFGLT
ncbi:MAG: IS4 family transposase [Gemmataceae bacterium]